MHTVSAALRMGAAATAITALTTLLLWLLPQLSVEPSGLEPEIGLAADPFHLARLWVNLGHVILALTGYAAAAFIASHRSPALAWASLAAFSAWALTETMGVSLNLWAVNLAWRPAYPEADESGQAALRAAILTGAGIWNGLFFVVLITFLIGTLTLGLSITAMPAALSRVVAVLLLLAVPLTSVILLDGYFGARLSAWVDWLYPVLQPLSRGVMAMWLWQEAIHIQRPQKLERA